MISVNISRSHPSAKPVIVGPTRTIDDRIGKSSHSSASAVAYASTPAFDTPYVPRNGRGFTVASEEMNTMSPGVPRSRSAATTRFETRIGPRRFVAMMRSCSSSLISCIQPGAAMPALFTSTSTGPSSRSVASRNASIESGRHTSSACANTRPPASVTNCAVSSSRSTRRARRSRRTSRGRPARSRSPARCPPTRP